MTIQYHDIPQSADKRVTDNGREIGTLVATDPRALSGLQPWSREQVPVLIFSVYRASQSPFANKQDHAAVAAKLAEFGIPFDSAHGCYDGATEQCFIINCTRGHEIIARTIAAKYEQESVLYITPGRVAFLETCEGETIAKLGKLRTVSQRAAQRARAYTFANDCYYVAGA